MGELVDLGASELNSSSGVVWAQCKGEPLDDGGASPDWGKPPLMCCLGVSGRPYPADERGSAQGIIEETSGLDGAIVAAHDPRAAKVYGEIQPGEHALHSTGPDFDSRFLAKNQLAVILVGSDYVVTVDRKNKKVAISTPGGIIQVSEKDGITLCDASGKGSLRLDGGVAALMGNVILGGGNPSSNVADAAKVDAEFARIWQMFSSWVVVPMDGGAALKTLAGVSAAMVQSTASPVALGS
ncbi:MAG TPA: hypothetical protein VGK73_08695 [Polyangiaceae bacterium]